MKLGFVLVVIFSGILSGCATSPRKAYLRLNAVKTVSKYGELSVIKNSSPIQLPATIRSIFYNGKSFRITKKDPVIDFGEYKSHYKVFAFNANKGEIFKLSIKSVCDCIGFRKFILIPNVYAADNQGVPIETKIMYSAASLSIITLEIEGSAMYSGEHYLVYGGNNSKPGERIAAEMLLVDGYIPTGIFVSSSSHPYGEIIPGYEIAK